MCPLELHLYSLLVPVLGDGPRKFLRTNRTTQSFGIGITRMGGSLSYGIKHSRPRIPQAKECSTDASNALFQTTLTGMIDDCPYITSHGIPQLKHLATAVFPGSLIALRHLPPACDTRAHAQELVAVLPELIGLCQRDRARPYDRDPFCQDEKTRLPAEMLRLDN